MKAWKVFDVTDPDMGIEIVFANDLKEAKDKSRCTDVWECVDAYTDIRVNRAYEFDDMENLSDKDFRKEQWVQGWFWIDEPALPNYDELDDEDVDKVWDEWYTNTYGGRNMIDLTRLEKDTEILALKLDDVELVDKQGMKWNLVDIKPFNNCTVVQSTVGEMPLIILYHTGHIVCDVELNFGLAKLMPELVAITERWAEVEIDE